MAIPIVAIPISEPVRIVAIPSVELVRILEPVRIEESRIEEPVRIVETPISEPVLILETPILVQIVETRIFAPIGVQSVVQNVRSSADLERVFHHHPEQPAARPEPAREQVAQLSIVSAAFVSAVAVPVRGRHANAAVHHQAPRQAIVAPRQSDVG